MKLASESGTRGVALTSLWSRVADLINVPWHVVVLQTSPFRVYQPGAMGPGLAVSRSFGDAVAHSLV